ncbi:hypothetical protein Nans01_22210 [Nocardiopsis ansamitocini]|uniref:Uncharacterized protein n=1 Tax=Nocardiopsis ansamitocini TaxID=1670832 RepID=A0A9W6UJB1_9ACTN|nr:hypothetical protein Nans01_22210 [Nocardiopsis ansamitocini]
MDSRTIRLHHPDLRVYRPGAGWTHPGRLRSRWALARLGLLLAVAMALAPVIVPAPWTQNTTLALCCACVAWLVRDGALDTARYTSVCMTLLASVLVLRLGLPLVGVAGTVPAGAAASLGAAQLYLVAGIRKLGSPHFMSGRVLADNIAYGAYQARAGSPDFFRVPSPQVMAGLLEGPWFLPLLRAAAIGAALVELTLGLGALGLLPGVVVVGLAVPTHLAFLAVSPRRIVPFTVASVGLLLIAVQAPVLR